MCFLFLPLSLSLDLLKNLLEWFHLLRYQYDTARDPMILQKDLGWSQRERKGAIKPSSMCIRFPCWMNVQKNNANKDRQEVESYIRLYCLEEILDEVMNHLILTLPQEPFLEISNFIQRKTLPEIFKVTISSIIVGCGNLGLCVEVMSNIGSFAGEEVIESVLKDDRQQGGRLFLLILII
jgi:hypothetical protein